MRQHLTYANVVATLCLVLVIGGGAAYAANTVFSGDIVDGEVKTADIANNAVRGTKIANAQVQSIDVRNDSLTGDDVDESTLDQGPGARAYAVVNPSSCSTVEEVTTCQAAQSKGVTKVTRLQTGIYCVLAPGVDPFVTPAAVSVEWQTTGGNPVGNSTAATSEFAACRQQISDPPGFQVVTQQQGQFPAVHAQGGFDYASKVGDYSNNVGFSIVIP